MSTALAPSLQLSLEEAVASALSRIPPLWPLPRFGAVNPFIGFADQPFESACARLQRVVGSAPLQSPAAYLEAFRVGEISRADLAQAAQPPWTADALLAALEAAEEPHAYATILTVADLLDLQPKRPRWGRFVVDEIAKWCAVHFDQNQTAWRSPWRDQGLYAAWREAAALDRNPEAFGLPGFRAYVRSLPSEADKTIEAIATHLAPPHLDLADFLHRQLATISGWAGHAQYLAREYALKGQPCAALRELLAIRLAYDGALESAFGRDGLFRANWRAQFVSPRSAAQIEVLVQWQNAYERAYQRPLAVALAGQPSSPPPARATCQAIFCIDVRSEIFRRHLESAAPTAQTLGFAGFFGFAVAHQRPGVDRSTARCPVLVAPTLPSVESASAKEMVGAETRRGLVKAWHAFQNSAASCFSFVETAGLGFAPLLARNHSQRRLVCRAAPRFALPPGARLETLATAAEGALRGMSLTRHFARLVLFCGHGSESANNPYASSLDCGACGGHAGDVNARLAAAVFNDPQIRARLADRGLMIPANTVFVAGLHNTTTDEVSLFDLESVPRSHQADLEALRAALVQAGEKTRAERAQRLGLKLPGPKLSRALRARSTDIAQVRPEWALVNNACFIAAPRARTAGLNLEGRAFLHEYVAAADPQGNGLTAILGGPVVVASWINLQYYASRLDPERYGAGNKVLHNLVAGLGAMEGNSGDLRVGLPLQSLHDGERFLHEPRRLSVFLEAKPARIEAALNANAEVKNLVMNGWIHLFALEDDTIHQWTPTRWKWFGDA